MIAYISGKIIYKDDKKIILDKAGIGFEIFLSPNNLNKLSIGESKNVYTFLFLGEKAIELYGFLTAEELELFKELKSVSGIGPKTAMSLAIVGSLGKLKEVIENGEISMYTKGVGVKKLQKILLEITGKIKTINKKPSLKEDPTFEALTSLGFSKKEIIDALSKVEESKSAEERIKEALRILGK